MSVYLDKFKCPKCGYERLVARRLASAGKTVSTYCCRCWKNRRTVAGPLPAESQEPKP